MRRGGLYLIGAAILGILLAGYDVFVLCSGRRDPPSLPHVGFCRRTFIDAGGASHNYAVFVPFEKRLGDRIPVIFFLHGSGEENGKDGIGPLNHPLGIQIWESKGEFPFLTVFPQCRKGSNWSLDGPDMTWALRILEEAISEFDADPDRVYLTGVSGGASAAWELAAAHPQQFAAFVPLCGTGSKQMAKALAEAHLPIWSFTLTGDTPNLVRAHREVHMALQDAGAAPHLSEIEGGGHEVWNFAYRNTTLFDWLSEQDRRSRNAEGKKFQMVFNRHDLIGWKAMDAMCWSATPEGFLVCQNGSGLQPSAIAAPDVFRNFELVMEFQVIEGGACEIWFRAVMLSEGIQGMKCILRRSEDGSGGIFDSVQNAWLHPRDARAQREFNPTGWNDFRLKVAGDHVICRLNGRKLIDFCDSRLARDAGSIVLQVPPRSSVRWRRVQVREE